jgi:inosose dehydratase
VTARFRVAAAPISWGICDVPGWGYQMPFTPVLAEMRGLGISASELGPAGFLPSRPQDARAALGSAGVGPVGTYLRWIRLPASRRDHEVIGPLH